MVKIFLILSLCFVCTAHGFAQQTASRAKISFRGAGHARIAVSNNKLNSTIDLSKNIAGCAFLTRNQSREINAGGAQTDGCAAPPATFKLIDATIKNGKTFLVVAADAIGRCNVCGRCGASESFTLIWLELDSRLRVVSKKNIVIDDCLSDLSSREVKAHGDDNLSDLHVNFKKDILTVEFEKTIFDEKLEIAGYEFSQLEYDRKTPEKGFIVKTEKRTKSSISE